MARVPDGLGGGLEKKNQALSAGVLKSCSLHRAFSVLCEEQSKPPSSGDQSDVAAGQPQDHMGDRSQGYQAVFKSKSTFSFEYMYI